MPKRVGDTGGRIPKHTRRDDARRPAGAGASADAVFGEHDLRAGVGKARKAARNARTRNAALTDRLAKLAGAHRRVTRGVLTIAVGGLVAAAAGGSGTVAQAVASPAVVTGAYSALAAIRPGLEQHTIAFLANAATAASGIIAGGTAFGISGLLPAPDSGQ